MPDPSTQVVEKSPNAQFSCWFGSLETALFLCATPDLRWASQQYIQCQDVRLHLALFVTRGRGVGEVISNALIYEDWMCNNASQKV